MRLFSSLAIAATMAASGSAFAQDTLVVGVQNSGTARWEITAMTSLGMLERFGLELEIRSLADSRHGQIALQTGAVDVILSDFVWVSLQRGEGHQVTMVPHSIAVGGLVVPPDSPIASVADLAGTTIAVAGGPADKSWVILQAYYKSLTGGSLVDDADARYGAPPLINELLATGSIDASLNFWQWNARAKIDGMVELISVPEMLSALGVSEQPPLLGWTFTEDTAATKPEALTRFLDASFATKQALLTDDAAWIGLAPLMGADDDPALFAQLRDDYRRGIVPGYDPDNMQAASQAFALLAQHGGSEVVADQQELAEGTFWAGYRH